MGVIQAHNLWQYLNESGIDIQRYVNNIRPYLLRSSNNLVYTAYQKSHGIL